MASSEEWLARIGPVYGYDVADEALRTAALRDVEGIGSGYGLKRSESLAIFFYTYQFPRGSPADIFRMVNNSLRFGKAEQPELTASIVIDLKTALHKLPRHDGIVFRKTALPSPVAARARSLQTFQDPGFLSSSLEPDVFEGKDMLVIRSRTGRAVAELSAFPSEREIVFLPDTVFSVALVEQVGTGLLLQLAEQV